MAKEREFDGKAFEEEAMRLEKSLSGKDTEHEPTLQEQMRKAAKDMEYDEEEEEEEDDKEEGMADEEHMYSKSHGSDNSLEKALADETVEYIAAEPILQELTKAITELSEGLRLESEPIIKSLGQRLARMEKMVTQQTQLLRRALPLLVKSGAAIKESLDSLPKEAHVDRGIVHAELLGKSATAPNGTGQTDQEVFLKLEQAVTEKRLDPQILTKWNTRKRDVLREISHDVRKSYGLPE
jgi:hypothetical protein